MESYCTKCRKETEVLEQGFTGNRFKCAKCHNPVELKRNNWVIPLILLTVIAFGILLSLSLSSAYSSTVTVSDTNLGQIRSDFYGANTGGRFLAGDMLTYGTNTTSGGSRWMNVTEYREAWEDVGLKFNRMDASLGDYYSNQTARTNGVNFTGNLTQQIETLKYMYSIGGRMNLIIDYMPTWLSDNSTGTCYQLKFCPPTNYTVWNNIVLDYLNRVTQNNASIQGIIDLTIWNEPEHNNFLGYMGVDNINKAIKYVELYNFTYNAIKNNNSIYPIGGWVSLNKASVGTYKNFTATFLSNASSHGYSWDFMDIHSYKNPTPYNPSSYDEIRTEITSLRGNCSLYNVDCSRVVVSEWNTNSDGITGNWTIHPMIVSSMWSGTLNYDPSNVSVLIYQFGSQGYISTTKWEMFSGRQLNATTFPTYNITKLFATNHKAGNTVYNSSSSNSSLKVVTSKDSTKTYITVTNTLNENGSIILNTSVLSQTGYYLRDVETGVNYTSANEVFNLGNISAYGVKTLSTESYGVSVNFGQTIRTLKNSFYGVSSGFSSVFSTSTMIDTDNNGVLETSSNITWHREKFLESGMKVIRKDMGIRAYYSAQTTLTNGVNMTGDLTNETNFVTWARNNDLQIIYIASYMHDWLANKSIIYCNTTVGVGSGTCPATNNTIWANTVVDFYNRVGCTPDLCSIEIWNEPDKSGYWLNNVSNTNAQRWILYGDLYNVSRTIIKTNNSNIKIGAPVLADVLDYTNEAGASFMAYFLKNYSADSFNWHNYPNAPTQYDVWITGRLNVIIGNCTFYNNNACNDIRLTELSSNNASMLNSSDQSIHRKELSALYSMLLNENLYENVSLNLFQWTTKYKYRSGDGYYPYLYNLVSEPQLDNRLYTPYNETKKYTRYANGEIKNSSSTYNGIKIVANTKNGADSIILTNTENNNKSIDLTITSPSSTLIDVESGTLYDTSDGSIQGLVLEPYDVVYLTEPVTVDVADTRYYYNYLGELLGTSSIEVSYQEADNELCRGASRGISSLGTAIYAIIAILGIALLVACTLLLVSTINGNPIFDLSPIQIVGGTVVGIFILIVSAVATMVATQAFCPGI